MVELGGETISWMFKGIFLSLVLLIVMFIVAASVKQVVNIQPVEANIFISQVIYSKNINYVDENNRIHPGVIDKEKLYEGELNKEFVYRDGDAIAAKLVLYEADSGDSNTLYYNRKWYENWEPIKGMSGKGGTSYTQKKYPVRIKDGENFKDGFLEVSVIISNKWV